jgi:hypothetical protein
LGRHNQRNVAHLHPLLREDFANVPAHIYLRLAGLLLATQGPKCWALRWVMGSM